MSLPMENHAFTTKDPITSGSPHHYVFPVNVPQKPSTSVGPLSHGLDQKWSPVNAKLLQTQIKGLGASTVRFFFSFVYFSHGGGC